LVRKRIPAASLVGIDRRGGLHAGADDRDSIALVAEHERQRQAASLAHDDDDLALTSLVLRLAAINAVVFVVRWPDVAADVSAIHLDFAI
jgi:hypothetical protein